MSSSETGTDSHIEFPATLPRTTSGKILRRNLRDRMTQQVMADYRIRH